MGGSDSLSIRPSEEQSSVEQYCKFESYLLRHSVCCCRDFPRASRSNPRNSRDSAGFWPSIPGVSEPETAGCGPRSGRSPCFSLLPSWAVRFRSRFASGGAPGASGRGYINAGLRCRHRAPPGSPGAKPGVASPCRVNIVSAKRFAMGGESLPPLEGRGCVSEGRAHLGDGQRVDRVTVQVLRGRRCRPQAGGGGRASVDRAQDPSHDDPTKCLDRLSPLA